MMGNVWQLQEAKNKFSNLVDKAHHEGPQVVTKHGKESVVIIAIEDYQKLNKPKSDLISFFNKSPLSGINLDLTRDKSSSRDIEL
ncbi:MAG: type II toxin-antitoxin system Phd/YefM family antitoxin [Proteobacteria bacterium]|nr:type II toxin-antitoxin system Phd/YefM family antitoxin [Pseudomonadota bacterium]MBU1714257.1 type II toxin-antitoxin system Phd/YefM family antitoxin [Pseudomonadota bacterium]